MKVVLLVLLVIFGVESRNVLDWPFASWSIWNLPLGEKARYVPAHLNYSTSVMIEPDPDILLLDPSQPFVDFMFSSAGWSGASRCEPDNPPKSMFSAPFPTGYIVPSDGNNYGTAILMPDNKTIKQTQPLCHCNSSTPVTTGYNSPDVDLYGDGIRGAHGGSGLSAIGGTIRMGEFIPDANGVLQPVTHALKSNLWAAISYYREACDRSTCFRWPAVGCDGYFCNGKGSYGGTNPAVRPGSLLAIDPQVDIGTLGLKTKPALSVAWTLQNYGLYLVDDSFWNAIALETELGPLGDYTVQFKKAWGLDFRSSTNEWAKDIFLIFNHLSVVDNWDESLYNEVTSSAGSQGAGGGTPRQPWAPDINGN
eukprot:TRINITY_DN14139_c0_g1_i1.p1 TRINITY_DN14139_c0_g1~~TRINITY_DN14139_c0_g1_i1.p1  ORF type:complete len:365 (-),score=80.49 TRINITY_DN14139_c0_g1_i1:3-1097(-)